MKLFKWHVLIPILSIALLASCFNDSRQITLINSFKEVNFDTIEPNSLVIFDVDETLIQPQDAFLINIQSEEGNKFIGSLLQKHPELDFDYLYSLILIQAERPLIEPDIISIINRLKQKGITVIACTYMNTGNYGILPTMEQWRYEHLRSLGFQGSYEDKIIKFEIGTQNPVFYKGMLATDLASKGIVVGKLLDKLQLHPTKIIMFDDSLDYLESMQEECKKRGLQFQGYLYQAAQEKPWDEQLAQFQADYLLKHEKWLSDEQASKKLAKNELKSFAHN